MVKYIFYWEEEDEPAVSPGQVPVPLNKEYFSIVKALDELRLEIKSQRVNK